jgi:hypothetical protein
MSLVVCWSTSLKTFSRKVRFSSTRIRRDGDLNPKWSFVDSIVDVPLISCEMPISHLFLVWLWSHHFTCPPISLAKSTHSNHRHIRNDPKKWWYYRGANPRFSPHMRTERELKRGVRRRVEQNCIQPLPGKLWKAFWLREITWTRTVNPSPSSNTNDQKNGKKKNIHGWRQ